MGDRRDGEGDGDGDVVRRADPADRPELARLRWEWRVGLGEEPSGTAELFASDFAAWAAENERSHVAFVAGPPGALVGMAWLALLERVPGPQVWTRRSAFVQSVYVEPPARGVGIGLALVRAALDEARARDVQYVTVHPTPASIPMYERAGFAPHANALRCTL